MRIFYTEGYFRRKNFYSIITKEEQKKEIVKASGCYSNI